MATFSGEDNEKIRKVMATFSGEDNEKIRKVMATFSGEDNEKMRKKLWPRSAVRTMRRYVKSYGYVHVQR